MTKILLLDTDGVCANFIQAYLDAVEEATGRHYVSAQVTQWDIAKAITKAIHPTRKSFQVATPALL
mgnify:CR=1 FL=1